MTVRTNLLLPKHLVDLVDETAGPRGRSRYIAEAIEMRVRRDQLLEVARETAGVWSAEAYPEFSTPEKVVAWVRARRAEQTDPGSEDTNAIDA